MRSTATQNFHSTDNILGDGRKIWHSQKVKDKCRRAFDMAVVIALSPVAVPLVGVSALAIYSCNGQNPFYKQQRRGNKGELFDIYKLKTYDDNGNLLKCARTIRGLKFDEFPQLLNVWKNNMSIVGARPHLESDDISNLSWRYNMPVGMLSDAKLEAGNNVSHCEEAVYDRRQKQKTDAMGLGAYMGYHFAMVAKAPYKIAKQYINKTPTSYDESGFGVAMHFGNGDNRSKRAKRRVPRSVKKIMAA